MHIPIHLLVYILMSFDIDLHRRSLNRVEDFGETNSRSLGSFVTSLKGILRRFLNKKIRNLTPQKGREIKHSS